MPLPDFLCIGAQKSGTTWLDQVLRSHPRIYMPGDKELHFFDTYYDKGLDWYRAQFPAPKDNHDNAVEGEVTPAYLYFSQAPQRIYDCLGADVKFIVILRNPVDRMYSQYKMAVIDGYTRLDPAGYFESSGSAFERGCYATQIERYFHYFSPRNFVFVIYERLFRQMDYELSRIADHLGVDAGYFDTTLCDEIFGAYSGKPRFHGVYVTGRKVQRFLQKRNIYMPVRLAKRLGVHNGLLKAATPVQSMSQAMRAEWITRYADDIARTEELTGLDLRARWGDPFDQPVAGGKTHQEDGQD